MSAKELRDWERYYEVEPWGEWRADVRMAILASTIANIHRSKDQKPFEPKDFMPDFRSEEDRRPSPEKFTEFIAALNQALGGSDLRSQRTDGA